MKKIIGLLIISLLYGSCAVQVKTYQKAGQDFSDYASWCWLKGCDLTYQGPEYYYSKEVMTEIANSIAYNMHQKGYQQLDDQSDLLVNFFIIMEEDSTEVSNEYDGMFNGLDMLPINPYPEYEKFLRGSLIIDVIDRKKSELVWRSNAVRYMEINPEYDRALIWEAVAKAMKKLPSQ